MTAGPMRRTAIAAFVAVLATLGLVGLSGLAYSPPGTGSAFLRLSWRARGEPVLACRRPGEEELARLPAHMRQAEVCEGRTSPFHLRLLVDGVAAVDDTVTASGARGDRPVYVYRELHLEPGRHQIDIAFVALGDSAAQATTGAHPFPRRLELSAGIEALAGRVVLVTYDEDRRALVARTGAR